MPLYELHRSANVSLDSNPTCSSGQSPIPENDLFELVCENGQILMHGHCNLSKNTSACKSLPSQCLPSYSPRARDMLIGNSRDAKFGKLGEFDSVIDEIPMTVPSSEMRLDQDEDLLPWMNYAIENPLQHEHSSDLLADLSGFMAYELPNRDSSSAVDKNISFNHANQNSLKNSAHGGASSQQGNVTTVYSNGEGAEAAVVDTSTIPLYQSSSEHQTVMASLRSREFNIQNKTSNGCRFLYSDDVTPFPSTSGSSDFKMLNQDSVLLNNSSTMMNFSHLARPAALLRANLHSIGAMCGLPSARTDSIANEERKFASCSSNAQQSTPTSLSDVYAKQSTEKGKRGMLPSKEDRPPLCSKPYQEHAAAAKPSEPVCKADVPKDEESSCKITIEDTPKGLTDGERSLEPVVASSVCSGNSVENAFDEPIPKKRRKTLDTEEESKCYSEDIDEESVGVKTASLARGGAGFKRSRAAEVHNLSERKRRDRINEKMRVLQELIPNCNKVDKASMLDEAIEYLKTLQLQVQMMSMGAGLCMMPMMLPTAMQPLHVPLMPSFFPMGVGMHVGFGTCYGMGMPDINGTSASYPVMQIPTVQGSQFPTSPTSEQIGSNGMAGSTLQMYGLPGHGLPFSMTHAPLFSGGPLMNPISNSASVSGSQDQTANRTTQITHSSGGIDSINQMTNQDTPAGCNQPALVQQHDHEHVQDVNSGGTGNSVKEDHAEP